MTDLEHRLEQLLAERAATVCVPDPPASVLDRVRRRRARSLAVAIALPVALALAVTGAALLRPTPSQRLKTADDASPTSPTVRSTFPDWGLSFEHPASWREQRFEINASFFSLVTYLSPTALTDPCTRTASTLDCKGWPLAELPVDGVLVEWINVGYMRLQGEPEVANPNTTISGQPARVDTTRPGPCAAIHGDETIEAQITRPHGSHFDARVCLRGPDLSSLESDASNMIRSTTVG